MWRCEPISSRKSMAIDREWPETSICFARVRPVNFALMNFQLLSRVSATLLCGLAAALAKLPPDQIAKLPAPASQQIDFARDIKPIFEAACVKCHGKGKDKGSFSLETHESFLKGGDSGSPI